MAEKKLTDGEIAEMKDLYDGTTASCRELGKLFGVAYQTIMWHVNHLNRKVKQQRYEKDYKQRKKNKLKE
ncbi:hypothetical protein KKH23_07670 [Patescibacteria group bacterium]|uniref:Uncharacterized protein n=1 Tax=viral metagenome TaxID=1070528 RepID=A0A6M3X6H2_9ZZZZ|nr:hypothetical protein [Patescibacteria group bacterium]